MKISIIIPTYNEEKKIAACLAQFRGRLSEEEVIVVDGGSQDNTVEIIRRFPGIKQYSAARSNRGYQLNKGAEVASGEWLVFLNADIQLPPDWRNELYKAAAAGFRAGCFRLAYGRAGELPLSNKLAAWLTSLGSHYTRFPYGHQAVFVEKLAFDTLGGYKDIPVMEDYEFSLRFYKSIGKFYRSLREVGLSFRRFRGRCLSAVITMWFFPKLFRLGISPYWLAKFYKAVR